MSRRARFEIVRTSAGWHARYRATNGQIIWVTESYKRRRTAINACGGLESYLVRNSIEIREVDER